MYESMYLRTFVEDYRDWENLAERKVVRHDIVIDNTLCMHGFGALGFPARGWHVIVVPIGLTLLRAGVGS